VPLARFQIIVAAILFSTGGAAVKGTSFEGFNGGLAVAALRSAVAAVALALLVPATRRNWSWRTVVVGAAFALTVIAYVAANKLTTSANTIFIQSIAPLWIAIGSPILLKERVPARDMALMGTLVAALSLFFIDAPDPVRTAPQPMLGNVIALISSVGWAATIMGLRWLGKTQGSGAASAATLAGNIIAFLVCIPFAAGTIQTANTTDWMLVVYLGLIQIAFAYLLLTRGVRHVAAVEASLLLLVEPAINPLWSLWFHGERIGPLTLLGGVVILAVTTMLVLRRADTAPPTRIANE
jgi:drug/metabolite transporter (DMT)-like permease